MKKKISCERCKKINIVNEWRITPLVHSDESYEEYKCFVCKFCGKYNYYELYIPIKPKKDRLKSKRWFDRILKMRLQRKIVKILQKKNNCKQYPSRAELEDEVVNRYLLRFNYWHFFRNKFEREVNDTLGDILPPHDSTMRRQDNYYIDYDYDKKGVDMLKVTLYGRDYIDWFGGLEEFLKRRSKSTAFLIGGGVLGTLGTILGGFINYYWNYIVQLFSMIKYL